jgi:peptidyl-prolyl cis-trans isomerase D
MLKVFQKRETLVRVFLGFVVGLIGLMMVITLAPGPVGDVGEARDTIAQIGREALTVTDVRLQLAKIERRQPIPRALLPFYTRQVVDQMVFERLLEIEARRLGIRVTDEEKVERIKLLLPIAFAGDTFIGMERYAAEIQQRFEMGVAEFEDLIRKSLLEEKFRRLATDGVTVAPEEIEREFRWRNDKVKLEYALLNPAELESRVQIEEPALAAFFEKNKARYQVPERRTVSYALLDARQLRQRASVTDEELRAYYNEHADQYRIQNRAKVSHILFRTLGKTDAEVQEIRKKAEEVLQKAKRGGKFDELARQYSEDTTKEAGGDLGWIVQGQTVPEFEKVAFSLPPGQVSDLVTTQYGLHIIRVAEREMARTRSFEEVKASILPIVQAQKAERSVEEQRTRIAAAVRESSRRPIEEIARQFGLTVRQTPPLAVGDPVGELGAAQELHDEIFRLRPGELSLPLQVEAGYVLLSVKNIEPTHQGTLAEVRSRAEADYRKEKAAELAKSLAEELAKRARSSEGLAGAAKALRLEVKTSEPFARTGNVAGVGSGRDLAAAFGQAAGHIEGPKQVTSNWIVYRVVSREDAAPAELDAQRRSLEQSLLQSKRQMAWDAFRTALQTRMQQTGSLKFNAENLARLTSQT